MDMHVRILTPEGEVVATPAVSVSLITELGAMQIFPGHASLHGVIELSPLRIEVDGQTAIDYVVQRGFVFISQEKDEVSIQVYQCNKRDELSHGTIKAYLDLLLSHLANPESLGAYHLSYLEGEKTATQKQFDLISDSKRT